MKPHDGIISLTWRRNTRVFSFSAFLYHVRIQWVKKKPRREVSLEPASQEERFLRTCKPRREIAFSEPDHMGSKTTVSCQQNCEKCIVFKPSACSVTHLCPTCNPVDDSPPSSSFMTLTCQEYWWWLSFPTPGMLNPISLAFSALAGGISYHWATWEAL